jgi:hypothetical protein
MHIVVYATIAEKNDTLSINGPFYYNMHEDLNQAEVLAKEIANIPTKDIVIVKVFEMSHNETLADIMTRARDRWLHKFQIQIKKSEQIFKRDHDKALCPFQDVDFDRLLKNYT